MHHFEDDGLTRYRDAVVDERSGKALVAAIEKVEAAGDYMVGSMPRKTVPRGYDKDSPRAKYLLWEGLPAMAQMTMADAMKPDFADRALSPLPQHLAGGAAVSCMVRDHASGGREACTALRGRGAARESAQALPARPPSPT